MGKNQAYKAMQRSRLGSSSAGPEEVEDGMSSSGADPDQSAPNKLLLMILRRIPHNLILGSGAFLLSVESVNLKNSSLSLAAEVLREESYWIDSLEIHKVAFILFLMVQARPWDEEDELKRDELEADKDRMMREYRAQLDAERARKLALGRNHSASKSHHKKDRKSKESKKRSSKKRKHKRSSESSSSGSPSESSSSDDDYDSNDVKESRRSRSKRSKKKRKHRSRAKHSSSSCSDSEESDGPVRLSKFFGVTVAKR
ncbi:hypothetical protein ZIOFF_047023 [Zingiber officinale]|uniref:Uncharacterized protein n=1 Tax=Zingiber officinale TaxID=94328 RepID=A0A8J5FM28_ZINOF|nr:hypothetical protein ZIOFF_047023 [Zingiber officinale]